MMTDKKDCYYCGGDCPEQPDTSEFMCAGFSGDIDRLYRDEKVLTLTRSDCQNLLDALREWAIVVGPKELDDSDWGLDYDRYRSLMKRLGESVK